VVALIRLVISEVRFARGRAVALGAGMVVAAVAFCLLTASVNVGLARINGVVGQNWRGTYDLLVLPKGSRQAKAGDHLVEVNYLSTATGGITLAQSSTIAHLPGVGVAAPLEIVGYVLETATLPVDLMAVAGTSGADVFSVTSNFSADAGLSRYPEQDDGYVYITPDALSPIQIGSGTLGPVETLPNGKKVTVCGIEGGDNSFVTSPFQRDALALNGDDCYSRQDTSSGPIEGTVEWSFPVLIAGIDPAAENELTGLGRAVTSGHYLANDAAPSSLGKDVVVPLLGSTASFDGDVDHVTVSQLPAVAVGVARSGETSGQILPTLEAEPSTPVLHTTITSAQAWQDLLSQLSGPVTADQSSLSQFVTQYWTVGQVAYHGQPEGQLSPEPVSNSTSVWSAGTDVNGSAFVAAPPAAADEGFRELTERLGLTGNGAGIVLMKTVGTFDPYKLAGFANAGPGSPLASYSAPSLTGATATSRAALDNQPLEPDGNMAGYAQQPPLLLTSLAGAAALEDPARFIETDAESAAPIGSIRVRVSGLRGSVQQQLMKIAAVGQEIRQATGLQVVVTAGASPEAVTIALPAAMFGRPALRLSEQWTAVMVALVVLQQADRESLALFALILVVCALFLAEAALAGVRARRTEIGVLRALGWGRRQVFVVVLGEVVMLGLLAGVAGTALAAVLIAGLKLALPLWRAALVLPVAVVLSLLAGLVPAWLAARSEPTSALAPAARAPRRAGLAVRSIAGLALTGLARVPGRCALAAVGLGVGVAALAVLLAAQASFNSSIGDSALAGLVTATTRGTDAISALLAVGLGAAAVADVTYLNLRERAGELAALEASGWGRRQIGTLLTYEALLTALMGSVGGGAVGLLAAAIAFGLSWPVVGGAVAAAAGGTLVALAGTAAVLLFTSDRPLAAVLAADE
jgi:putative ABC transport system permease protein